MLRRCSSAIAIAALLLPGVLPGPAAAQRPHLGSVSGHSHQQHQHQHNQHRGFRGGGVFGGGVFGGGAIALWPYSSALYSTPPPVVYAPAPPPIYYAAPPSYYAPPAAVAPPAPTAPPVSQDVQPTPREVVFPEGRWVLHGDGVATPYKWVWIPAPPTAPPPGASRPAPAPERAIYAWTDPSGVTTYTDRLSKVPPEHRANARREP